MTPASGSLLLFSSASGARYGYDYDGWKDDGAFHYTGEGQVGDQRFTRGNLALRDCAARRLRPRLFEEVRRSVVCYLGEFKIDEQYPWYTREATDRYSDLRKVIVFRLMPVAVGQPKQPSASAAVDEPRVRDVPVEAYVAETFQVEPSGAPTIAERREADLVQRYIAWLNKTGIATCRKEIKLPDQSRPLYADLFDIGRAELVEAKSSASRTHVRHALGQLLDYARYVKHSSLAVLLPTDPGQDLTQLLHSSDITCIFEDTEGHFGRTRP